LFLLSILNEKGGTSCTLQSHNSEARFHINANVDKTVCNLYEINREINSISGILIGRKTRVNTKSVIEAK